MPGRLLEGGEPPPGLTWEVSPLAAVLAVRSDTITHTALSLCTRPGHPGVSIFQEDYFEGTGLICTATPCDLILGSVRGWGRALGQGEAGAP